MDAKKEQNRYDFSPFFLGQQSSSNFISFDKFYFFHFVKSSNFFFNWILNIERELNYSLFSK